MNTLIDWQVRLDLHKIVIVNLSAFVLVGSHLVLSNTKAETILGGCFATYGLLQKHGPVPIKSGNTEMKKAKFFCR